MTYATDITNMSMLPAAVMCPMTKGKAVTGFGWLQRDLCARRNRLVSVTKHGRNNQGSGVT
ncbi:hypothetical protein [Actomonas aquatica]|uniref:Uncharacterized protein n=1 Tax=Actomonas aquatica TaxID=2866162 RepID=A0ABZ1C336_9BACT|nr:hypothetical protein [Opitutus sp. WL0086]WRQ85896.1 hypothetical protein K1X11_013870 [Opitutus sp. WL0086]